MLRQLYSSPGGEFSAGAAAKRCAIEKTNRPRNLDWAEGCEKPFPQRGPSFLSDRSDESEPTSSGQFSLSQLGGGDAARRPLSGLLSTRRGSSEQLGLPSSEPHSSSKKLGQSSSELHPPSKKLRPPSPELKISEQKVPMAEFEPPSVDHKARRASFQAPMTEQKASWCCCKQQHAQSKKPRGWRLERHARGLKGRERGVKCRGQGSGRQRRLPAGPIAT